MRWSARFVSRRCALRSIANLTRTLTTTFCRGFAHLLRIILATIQPSTIGTGVISSRTFAVTNIHHSSFSRGGSTCRKKSTGEGHSDGQKQGFHLLFGGIFSEDRGEWLHCPNIRSALFADSHFPTQKFLNIVPSTSSVVTSPPVISARWWMHSRRSCATKSPEMPDCKPRRTRRTSSRAAVSAA